MAAVGDVTRHPGLLPRRGTGLIVVDVQEAFVPVIDGFDEVVRQIGILISGFGVLDAPMIVTEQYPKGLGHTVDALRAVLPEGVTTIEKMRFSACGVDAVEEQLAASGCERWVVCGVETHVCVNQTALDLLARGLTVHVPTDAVSSRTPGNRSVGLQRMAAQGATLTSVETVLFEMLEEAGSAEFKAISKLVR